MFPICHQGGKFTLNSGTGLSSSSSPCRVPCLSSLGLPQRTSPPDPGGIKMGWFSICRAPKLSKECPRALLSVK